VTLAMPSQSARPGNTGSVRQAMPYPGGGSCTVGADLRRALNDMVSPLLQPYHQYWRQDYGFDVGFTTARIVAWFYIEFIPLAKKLRMVSPIGW